jgi:hypothetical protein
VAEIQAKRKAALSVPLATAELEAAGFQVVPASTGGEMLTVNAAPGLRAKLDELEVRGIKPPLVGVIRKFTEDGEVAW